MKKTDLAKSDAKKLMGQMGTGSAATFGAAQPPMLDRREQRKRDQALGLVPFAVKLNADLVKQLLELSRERGVELNQLVADVLAKGLEQA